MKRCDHTLGNNIETKVCSRRQPFLAVPRICAILCLFFCRSRRCSQTAMSTAVFLLFVALAAARCGAHVHGDGFAAPVVDMRRHVALPAIDDATGVFAHSFAHTASDGASVCLRAHGTMAPSTRHMHVPIAASCAATPGVEGGVVCGSPPRTLCTRRRRARGAAARRHARRLVGCAHDIGGGDRADEGVRRDSVDGGRVGAAQLCALLGLHCLVAAGRPRLGWTGP